jgi:hypothetical protein
LAARSPQSYSSVRSNVHWRSVAFGELVTGRHFHFRPMPGCRHFLDDNTFDSMLMKRAANHERLRLLAGESAERGGASQTQKTSAAGRQPGREELRRPGCLGITGYRPRWGMVRAQPDRTGSQADEGPSRNCWEYVGEETPVPSDHCESQSKELP